MLVSVLEQVYQHASSRATERGLALRASGSKLPSGLERYLEECPARGDLFSEKFERLFE